MGISLFSLQLARPNHSDDAVKDVWGLNWWVARLVYDELSRNGRRRTDLENWSYAQNVIAQANENWIRVRVPRLVSSLYGPFCIESPVELHNSLLRHAHNIHEGRLASVALDNWDEAMHDFAKKIFEKNSYAGRSSSQFRDYLTSSEGIRRWI